MPGLASPKPRATCLRSVNILTHKAETREPGKEELPLKKSLDPHVPGKKKKEEVCGGTLDKARRVIERIQEYRGERRPELTAQAASYLRLYQLLLVTGPPNSL